MQVGDTVLHPRYGVGIIGSIESRVQDGERRDFYVIPKPSLSSTIFVPVDTADELGLRPVAPPETLKEVLNILKGRIGVDSDAPGFRTLTWNDPIELAHAIRKQANEPKPRYPKVSLQHQLKRAKKLLAEEVGAVLGISEDSFTAIIDNAPVADVR